jgi:hypothetical protein
MYYRMKNGARTMGRSVFGLRRTAVLVAVGAIVVSAASCKKSPAGPSELPVTSSFVQGDEGWTVVGDGTMFYHSTGGNPPSTGFIFAIDRTEGDTFYFNAPGKFRGNMSNAYGRRLTFDLAWSENSPSDYKEAADIILRSGDVTITTQLPHLPGTTWTPYSIPLDTSGGWVVQATGQPATVSQMQAVLASVQQFRIRGEFRVGAEQGNLDNVRFGVE